MRWTRLDARDSLTLRYVSTDPQVEAHAGALLAERSTAAPISVSGLAPDDLDALAERHNAEWQAARETHVARAGAVAEQRIASLRAQRDSQTRAIEESRVTSRTRGSCACGTASWTQYVTGTTGSSSSTTANPT